MTLQAYASDTTQSGGRGSPNAWSPASDGENYTQATGAGTLSLVTLSALIRAQITNSTVLNIITLGALQFVDVDQYVTVSASSLLVKIGLISRYLNTNNYYRCDWTGSNIELFANVNGSGTVIATHAISNFTPTVNTFYTIHFRTQGFAATGSNTNNLMANIYVAGTTEPAGWQITASDANLVVQGNYGYYYKATTTAQTGTFDSYTVTDCPPPTNVPAFNTTGNRPYGATMYVPNNSTPPLPSQTIIDMIGTCSLGTNSASATGLGQGSWLRYQMRWKNVETFQVGGTSYYDWAIMDDAVQKANYWGFRLLWPIQAPPDWQKTRDALGSQATLTATRNVGAGPFTTLAVTALPDGAYIPHRSKLSIDYGTGNAETVFVWNPAATYTIGTTSIGISTSTSSQIAWSPAHNHAIGAVVWEATANATPGPAGGPQWASASTYATFCSLVATRYNGISGYGKLDMMQIENEDYDTTGRIGAQGPYGVGANSPSSWDMSSTWDNGGAILAPVYVAARNAIRAVSGMGSLNVFPCSVRKTPNTGRQHVQNWVTGFMTKVLAGGGGIDGIDFHYYRDGTVDWDGSLVIDPSISTYTDHTKTTINAPAVQVEVADIVAIGVANGISPMIMAGETGWPIYDDGGGVLTGLSARVTNAGGPYMTLYVDDGTGLTKTTNQAYNHGTSYGTIVFTTATGATVQDATPIYVENNTNNTEVVYAYGTQTTNATLNITTNSGGQAGGLQVQWNPAITHSSGVQAYVAGASLPGAIQDTTPISIDYNNTGITEIVYAYGTTVKNKYAIPITTNALGSGATQAGWTPTSTHAIAAQVYGATTTVPIPLATQSDYLKKMYDALRLGGGDYAFIYTMDSIASILHSTTNPAWSGRPDGVTQIVGGVYTYELAYSMTAADSVLYPSWSPLTLYLAAAVSATISNADQLYSVGGTPTVANHATLVGTNTAWGELFSKGTNGTWAALGAIGTPSDHGFVWDSIFLEGQQLIAGVYTATLRLQAAQSNTPGGTLGANIHYRVWNRSSAGAYTLVVDMSLTGQTITSTATNYVLTGTTTGVTPFAIGDKLVIDIWLNITSNTNANAGQQIRLMNLSTDTTGMTGSTNMQLVLPGFQPAPGGPPPPPPPPPGTGAYVVKINGVAVFVVAGSLNITSTIGKRSTASFMVLTDTSTHFQQYQRVSITDQVGNLAFSGYITQPKEQKPGFQPNLVHSISCVDQHYLADKRIIAATYTNKTIGFIAQDIVTNYLAVEGVTVARIDDGPRPDTTLFPSNTLFPGSGVSSIPQATFVYCSAAQAFDALAAQQSTAGIPYYWQIDQNLQFWFVPYTAVPNITVVDGSQIDHIYQPPSVTRANPTYRNTQYIVGGVAQTVTQTETRLGDSNTVAWTMGYDLSTAPTITVNGAAKTVGVKGITTGQDFYWAQGDPVITQDSGATKLTNAQTLQVVYIGQYPTVIVDTNNAQVSYQQGIDGSTGINEQVVNDATITSITNGLSEAAALLTRYAQQGLILQFTTKQTGYAQGQLITAGLAAFGLTNAQMLIESVVASDQQDGINIWYTINAVQGPYDVTWEDFFSKLLRQTAPANSINIGIGQSLTITKTFNATVMPTATFTATVLTALFPSNTLKPNTTLFPA